MSCHGAILEEDWDHQLGFWGLTTKEIESTKKECMRECVLGNHEIANVRRSRIETERTGDRSDAAGTDGQRRAARDQPNPGGAAE
eukprot:2970584-Rhodomonas_salina.1